MSGGQKSDKQRCTFWELGQRPKKGCPEDEVDKKYREAMATLETRHKLRVIEEAARDSGKSDPGGFKFPDARVTTGCGCVIWYLLVVLVGFTVAACMSWIFNHSMSQAILHGVIGWFYVCYKAFWYVVATM